MKKTTSLLADNTGITSAILCTIHCLVVPVLFLVKFWWGSNSTTALLPAWWGTLDYLFLGISFWAVYHSATHTTAKNIRLALWLFWAMLTIAILFEDKLHWLAYIASAGLVATHITNIRRMRKNAQQLKLQASYTRQV